MAKISEYGNYDTDKSQAEVEKFQETGVLPVSGKYTDNGNMTTKNVKLSDLVGGGGGDAESLAGQGLYADDGKLTVVTDDTLRIVDAGYMTEPRYKVSVTNSVPTPGANHADVGKVLTVKNNDNTDEIVWDTRFPTIPNDYSSKDYFLHINQSNGTIEWAEIPAAGS